jgi:hypothetical protein
MADHAPVVSSFREAARDRDIASSPRSDDVA